MVDSVDPTAQRGNDRDNKLGHLETVNVNQLTSHELSVEQQLLQGGNRIPLGFELNSPAGNHGL